MRGRGINLGGWLSQCDEFSERHYESFIRKDDIARIADIGFNHVRLPIDYSVLENDDNPYVYREDGFSHINDCLDWAKHYNLGIIIDLHSAPGFRFNRPENTTLFADPVCQERFISLWREIAKRYRDEGASLEFELLNEIVLPDGGLWNEYASRIIKGIREIDERREIVIGGNNYNSVNALHEITIFDDPHVIYTFHFYEPMLFTHQKASWIPVLVEYNRTLDYPGSLEGVEEFVAGKMGDSGVFHDNVSFRKYIGKKMNGDLLAAEMQQAFDFQEKMGKPLYCGEFGVIDKAPMEGRMNWIRAVDTILDEHGIGRALWTYKNRDFGLVDKNGKAVDDRLYAMFR
jgi:endoglucanase